MLQTGKPACSHARIPPPSWYALPGALLSKSSALFRVLFPERQKKTTGLPEKRLSSPSPRSNASRGTSGQPGIARLRNSFSVRTSTKKGATIAKKRHGLLWGQCFQHRKNHSLKSGERGGVQAKRQGHAMRKSDAAPKGGRAIAPSGFSRPSARHKTGHPNGCPPSFTSGVRRTASALWSAGPSARFPAIFPAGSCR